MKNVNIKIISSLLLIAFLFSYCTKEDDYDYNAIEPKVFAIIGPAQTAASGLAPVEYAIAARGGSTTAWTVTGHGASIASIEGKPWACNITFAQSDVDVNDVSITVIETSLGGISSEPYSTTVDLVKFKPMAFSDFLGDWSFVETLSDGSPVASGTITLTGNEATSTIIFPVTNGIPSLMGPLFTDWGEQFQSGHGNNGAVNAIVNLYSGAITIAGQYWGQTEPGPWDYWINGSGNWEGFNKTMTIEYAMQFDESYTDNYNASIMVLTKL